MIGSIPLPVFIAVPLVTAFVLPLFGKKGGIASAISCFSVLVLLILSCLSIGQYDSYEVGRWPIPLGINLVLDGFSCLLLLAISTVSFAAIIFSVRYMEQYTAKPKFLCLCMLMITGMNGVVLSGDIFNLFVFLEIASIASYALVGFGCEHEELEASFKYMTLGSIGSLFVLFGIALVYGNTGSLNMAYIGAAIRQKGMNPGLAFAMALFVGGFSLKAAMIPFHAWLPDAHPSAPAPISAMLSGVLIKALGVYALVRIIFNVFAVSVNIGWLLIALGIGSMVGGALLAMGQWDLKRLLAYSSISQVGYVVLGFGMGALIIAQGGELKWASLSIMGGLFHLINHAVYKSLLFLASGSIQMSTGTRDLKKLGGLSASMPITCATSAIASASIVGIPPFSGFWSKVILAWAAVAAGFYWIAAVIFLVSLCTLIMYLKVQRYVFMGDVPADARYGPEDKGMMAGALIFLACLCVLMGLIVIVPGLRAAVLETAVQALTDGILYSSKLIGA